MSENRFIIRSDIRSNWLLAFLVSIPWMIGIFATIKNPATWSALFVASAFFFLFLYWLSHFSVSFDSTTFFYKSPFGREQRLRYSEISKVAFCVGFNSSRYALFQLRVGTAKNNEEIIVNTKPFSTDALSLISQKLLSLCPGADFDQSVNNWAKKDFSNLNLSTRQRIDILIWLSLALTVGTIMRALFQ